MQSNRPVTDLDTSTYAGRFLRPPAVAGAEVSQLLVRLAPEQCRAIQLRFLDEGTRAATSPRRCAARSTPCAGSSAAPAPPARTVHRLTVPIPGSPRVQLLGPIRHPDTS